LLAGYFGYDCSRQRNEAWNAAWGDQAGSSFFGPMCVLQRLSS
jgi:hypothetical protein